MHTYKVNDPLGWCGDPRRGAAIGRPAIKPETEYAGELRVRRVPLDDGYDPNGTYFGAGSPLYWVFDPDAGEVDLMLRASCRHDALAQARKLFPQARIRRTKHDSS